jgi:peroxiredoxin
MSTLAFSTRPAAAGLLALLIGSMSLAFTGAAQAKLATGNKPDFQVRTMSGQTLSPKVMQGRIVIIEFWATWCPPCVEQLPHLRKLYHQVKNRGVSLVSVSLDDRAGTAKRFADNRGMVWPQVHDASQSRSLAEAWGVSGIPHAFIFSPDAKLIWRGHPARMDQPLKKAIQTYKSRITPKQNKSKDKDKQNQQASGANQNPSNAKSDPLFTDRSNWKDTARQLNQARRLLSQQPPAVERAFKVLGQLTEKAIQSKKLKPFATRLAKAAKQVQRQAPQAWQQAEQAQASGAKRLSALRQAVEAGHYQPVPPKKVRQARLRQADKLRQAGRDLKAFGHYRWLVKRAKSTDAGQTAAQHVQRYENDQAFMERWQAHQQSTEAKRLLRLARNYADAGRDDLAQQKYRRLVKQYPDTDAASQAQQALASR